MRAAIRAKVTAARLERADADAQRAIVTAAAGYFAFAQRAIAPPPPKLIAIGGLSGTGKSELARALAPQLGGMPGAVIVRSDVERKALFGVGETDKLPEQAYAADATARVYGALAEKARRIVAAGHSAIVDAVFAKPEERSALAAMAQSAGLRLHGLFLTAPLTIRLARVGGRSGDASDADRKVAKMQESYDLGTLDWVRIEASGTLAETAAKARAALD
jgi:predicted kinase